MHQYTDNQRGPPPPRLRAPLNEPADLRLRLQLGLCVGQFGRVPPGALSLLSPLSDGNRLRTAVGEGHLTPGTRKYMRPGGRVRHCRPCHNQPLRQLIVAAVRLVSCTWRATAPPPCSLLCVHSLRVALVRRRCCRWLPLCAPSVAAGQHLFLPCLSLRYFLPTPRHTMGGVKAEPVAPPSEGAMTRRRAAEAYAANTTMTRRRTAQLTGASANAAAVKAEPAAPATAPSPSPTKRAVLAKRGGTVKAEPAAPVAAGATTSRGGAAKRGASAAPAAAAAAGPSPPKRAKGKAAASVAAAGPSPPKRGKGKAAAPADTARGLRKRRGLGGTRAPSTSGGPLGIVDPRSNVDGAICVDEEGIVYDVTLNLRDAATNCDKYYILQLIGATDGRFVVFSHYGRTGTAGQGFSVEFGGGNENNDDDEAGEEPGLVAALDAFAAKFKEKTGLDCDAANLSGANPPVPGKYRVVVMDHAARAEAAAASHSARWQYWVDDGVDGKPNGWYDYDAGGAAVTEGLFVEWGLNAWLTERVVASGAWTYLVNLSDMSQTNLEHYAHTRRRIRRVPPGIVPDNMPPV